MNAPRNHRGSKAAWQAVLFLALDWAFVADWIPFRGYAWRVAAALALALLLWPISGVRPRLSWGRVGTSLRVFGKVMAWCSLAVAGLLACIAVAGHSGWLQLELVPQNLRAPEHFWLWFWPAVVHAPLAEELIYRGLIQARLRAALPAWAAILCSGFLFWVMHWIAYERITFPNHFLGGLVIAWSYEKTRSLLAPTLLHAAGNLALGLGDLLYLTHPELVHALLGTGA